MSVYVDRMKAGYGRMVMCHMIADTLVELHEMADRIGVQRKWFQAKSHPHYDVCLSKRTLALRHGAIEVDNRGLVEVMNRYRVKGNGCPHCQGCGSLPIKEIIDGKLVNVGSHPCVCQPGVSTLESET